MTNTRVRWWWWFGPVAITATGIGLAIRADDWAGVAVFSAFTIFCSVLLWAAWRERRRHW